MQAAGGSCRGQGEDGGGRSRPGWGSHTTSGGSTAAHPVPSYRSGDIASTIPCSGMARRGRDRGRHGCRCRGADCKPGHLYHVRAHRSVVGAIRGGTRVAGSARRARLLHQGGHRRSGQRATPLACGDHAGGAVRRRVRGHGGERRQDHRLRSRAARVRDLARGAARRRSVPASSPTSWRGRPARGGCWGRRGDH